MNSPPLFWCMPPSASNTLRELSAWEPLRDLMAPHVARGCIQTSRELGSCLAGLFDTAASQSEVYSELSRAMAMSRHGIHAILLVFTTSARFTAEEVACLNYLRSAYGGQLLRHCILVFTHGDSLEEEEMPLDEFLRNCPESLQVHRQSSVCRALLEQLNPKHTCCTCLLCQAVVQVSCTHSTCKLLPC